MLAMPLLVLHLKGNRNAKSRIRLRWKSIVPVVYITEKLILDFELSLC